MDVRMDPMENSSINADNNTGEGESSGRPSLSQMKKSWGFRRTTIARREFLDEVGDLNHSPPPARKSRSRKTNQTAKAQSETRTTQKASRPTKSVLDGLEWSAPSSPASEESKPASETCTPGSFDPSLWQDIGSAFDTAFSLLGGGDDLSMDLSDAMAIPKSLEATDAIQPSPPQDTEETEMADEMDSYEMEISQPVAPDDVAGREMDDVVLISSQEEDSDEMTLIQIKEQMAARGRQGNTGGRGGKGGRGKARGKGRGRGKGKGRGKGRGRGRGMELLSSIADHEDDDVVLVNPAEQQLQKEDRINSSHSPSEIEISPAHSVINLSPAQQSGSDCILIDTDLDHITDVTPNQFDDAPEEEKKTDDKNIGEFSSMPVSDGHDSETLCCICRQKHEKRSMISCHGCLGWFHGDCVDISDMQVHEMIKEGQEYICPSCTTQRQSQLQPELQLQPEPQHQPLPKPEISFLEFSRPPDKKRKREEEPLAQKETVVVEEKVVVTPLVKTEPEAEVEMETGSSRPLCIGPGCSRPALQDSVYCGTDCILQHAAFTMKTLTGPKESKTKGRGQARAAAAKPAIKGQRPGRMSKRLAEKAKEENEEEQVKEDNGGEKEVASSSACDPSEVQTSSIHSSKFYTACKEESEQEEANIEAKIPPTQPPEENSDAAPSSEPTIEQAPPQSQTQERAEEPVTIEVPKQKSVEQVPCVPTNPAKHKLLTAIQSPLTSAPRHHKTGALIVSNTTYVIPKKQSGPQPQSSQVPASAQKTSPAPALVNETRNLPVPPAPSAPSSRPSQPNNQVRQSIQRSLTSILSKRVSDCEDLEFSDSEVTKLVANIEMEMFDIFRNTDSKYMNKYRTIMFNLKDPKNKGLLYNVVNGEINPFRLVRMSQKDMQAVKASEPSPKATTEVKDAHTKAPGLLQKPEAVKVDLPSLNPTRSFKSMAAIQEPKKSLPPPPLKTRGSQPSQGSTAPNILDCMLKDTTSEHKAHLFDLKCKICTGQIIAGEDGEPVKKKNKVPETRDRYEPPWRQSTGGDSPLLAPPDSPDMDSPTSSRLIIDAPPLTIVESPVSPVMDSPASPTLESPASPIMDSPASPTPETSTATLPKRAYTPVVIPAVSTVTISRRDPRTAAGRFSALSGGPSGPSNPTQNQTAPYAPFKDVRPTMPPAPAAPVPLKKPLPKSILMKPSSSSDPRLYGTSSRVQTSGPPAEGETAQFLAKEDIVWKGFLNMLTIAKFVTKAYLVSGPAENLKADLPDTIQIGGRILPQTVWDYVAKLKTSVSKELCVIRFHPATEEEEVAYVSLFSYFSSRGRFGVVSNISRSIKDVYLVPLSAKESIPPILLPFEGPGLEKNRPNLLLGLAIIQKTKRTGSLPQEIEEKRPKVHMSKDPMWIPKPPVLYGSDKLEIFQPYDPEIPINITPPSSPPCPGSPSGSSSSGSVIIPSLLTAITAKPPVSTPSSAAAPQPSNTPSGKDPSTVSSDATPLQTILKTLFSNKKTDSIDSSDGGSSMAAAGVKKAPALSQVSGSIVDPIVQQYGQKSKVKELEEEEDDFDRPYDPEEEYEPAMGYQMVAAESIDKTKTAGPAVVDFVDDDVAYDPEDDTIFADFHSDTVTDSSVQTPSVSAQTSEVSSLPISTQPEIPTSTPTRTQTSTLHSMSVTEHLPTGTVVVSAATLTEQQRMLEELNKQIEEQKRQLKEQEEALRQQREAVGMFMAHFSVSDSLMSPPTKAVPLGQLSSLQSSIMQTESRPSELTNKSNLPETANSSNMDSQSGNAEDTTATPNVKNEKEAVTDQAETQENVKESDKCSSAGEVEDSDVAYDPEDESLFNEIQEDVFQVGTRESPVSRSGRSASRKGSPADSYHSRKRRPSPKRHSNRERDRRRSPSRKSQRRSPSHSRRHRERDRHRKSERERSGHRTRDHSERQARHHRERTASRHSRGQKRSPSSHRKKDSVSPLPKRRRGCSAEILENADLLSEKFNDPDSSEGVVGQVCLPITIQKESDGDKLKGDSVESPDEDQKVLHNVKLETAEPSKSQDMLKKLGIAHDDKYSSSTVDKPPLHETLLNKIDSTIPLREIDPPIRDSPESPDPDPQFVKPNSKEQQESVLTEGLKDPFMNASVLVPVVKVEDSTLSICGQETLSNVLRPTPLSDAKNVDFTTQKIQFQSFKDEMKKACKQIKEESLGLDDVKTLGQVAGHSVLATSTDIQSSESAIDSLTKCTGFDVSNKVMRSPGPEMKDSGTRVPDLVHSEPEMRKQMPVTNSGMIRAGKQSWRDPVTRGPSPSLKCSGRETGNPQGQWLEGGKEHMANTMNSEWRGPGTDIKGQMSQNEGQGPLITAQNWNDPVKGRRDEWREPERKGSGPYSGGQFMQDEHRERQNWRCQNMEGQGSGRITSVDENVREPVLERNPNIGNLRYDEKDQEGLDFRRREHERKTTTNNDKVPPNTRRTGAQEFLGTGMESIFLAIKDPGFNREGTDHRRPWADKMCLDMDSHEPNSGARDQGIRGQGPESRGHSWADRQGPARPDFSEMGPERKDLFIESHGTSRRGPGGQDFREQGHKRSSPAVEGPRSDRKGPGDSDFRGSECQRRGIPMEGPGYDRRGPGNHDIRALGPERRDHSMEVPVPSRRGPRDTDIRGPSPQRRGPPVEGPGHNWARSGDPDFSGLGSLRRSPSLEGLGPDKGGPKGPDFKGPGPERRGPPMEGHRTHKRGPPGGPESREFVLERSDPSLEAHGHDRGRPGCPDFKGPWPERRNPSMERTMPDRGSIDFGRHWSERSGVSTEGHGHDMSDPEGQDCRLPVPKKRGPPVEPHGHDARELCGPAFRQQGPVRRGPPLEGLGPERGGPEGLDFRGRGPERRGPSIEGPGSNRVGPEDQDFRGPWSERRDASVEEPMHEMRGPGGSDFRGPGAERRSSSVEGPGHDSRMIGDPDFRGPGPQRRGHPMGGPEHDRGGPGGQVFKGPGPERRGPPLEHPAHIMRQPGGPEFKGPGPERRRPPMQGPGQGFRRPGPERGPTFKDPWTDRETHGQGFRGQKPEWKVSAAELGQTDFSGSEPERPDTEFQGFKGPDQESPHTMDSQEQCKRGPGGPPLQGKGPGRRRPEGPDLRGPGNERSSFFIQGPGPDRERPYTGELGPDFIECGPDSADPGVGYPGPYSREKRGPHPGECLESNRWGPDIRGPRLERPGSGLQEDPNNRGLDQHFGPNSDGTGQYRRGPNRPGPEGRFFNKEGPLSGRGGQHFRGRRPDSTVVDGPGPGKRDIRSDFREPRPEGRCLEGGPETRRLDGPDFRNPGYREDMGHSDFSGSEYIQDDRGPRRGQNLRGRGPMRRGMRGSRANQINQGDRWKGSDFKGFASDWRSTDAEQQWSDERGLDIMPSENEGDICGDDWKKHSDSDRGPDHIQEGPNEQVHEFIRQGPEPDWRGRGRRGRMPIQERPSMPFSGHCNRPGDERSVPNNRGQGPAQDNPICPGPGRARPRGSRRGGPGPYYRGGRHPDGRGRGRDRIPPDMRGLGSDLREDSDMGNEEGPEAHRGGPDFINSCPNRGLEFESIDRRGTGGPNLTHPGPDCRNSNSKGPAGNERFPSGRGRGFERQSMGIGSETGRRGLESDFKRERRDQSNRRQGLEKTMRGPAPERSDIRHGPGRWNPNTEDPGLDPSGFETAPPHFNSPEQVPRFQGPRDPHSAPHNRHLGASQNRRRNPCAGFENQQVANPQRHKGALLPTPSSQMHFSNPMLNKPNRGGSRERNASSVDEKNTPVEGETKGK